MADTVCKWCFNLRLPATQKWRVRDIRFPNHQWRFCALVFNLIADAAPACLELQARNANFQLEEGILRDRPLHLVIINSAAPPVPKIVCYVPQTSEKEAVGSNLLVMQELSNHASACLDLAKTWLQDCIENHEQCKVSKPSWMPSRLLYIKSKGSQFDVQLVEGVKPQEYVALSHCWGREPTLRTEKHTISKFKSRIPWLELPQTFQHAIVVTASLGKSYIWIDSLCIIQNDPLDWEKEASQMADIYENSLVTISASSAPGDRNGFLHQRPKIFEGLQQLENPGLPPTPVRYREALKHYESKLEDPIDLRAWCYQERLLSRRTLLFTTHELRWECDAKTRCECDPNPKQSSAFSDAYQFELSSGETLYSQWYTKILPRYTNRVLTKDEDKLPALAGVASRFSKFTGAQYIAGLWHEQNELLYGLLWIATDINRCISRLYTAPSFSWASRNGGIGLTRYYNRGSVNWNTELIETSAQPAGLDPYGKVSAGHVILRGPLVRVWLHPAVDENGSSRIQLEAGEVCNKNSVAFIADTPLAVSLLDNKEVAVHRARDDRECSKGWFSVHCLKLGRQEPMPNEPGVIFCLVLGMSIDTPGTFERLGLYCEHSARGPFLLNRQIFDSVEMAFSGASIEQVTIL